MYFYRVYDFITGYVFSDKYGFIFGGEGGVSLYTDFVSLAGNRFLRQFK